MTQRFLELQNPQDQKIYTITIQLSTTILICKLIYIYYTEQHIRQATKKINIAKRLQEQSSGRRYKILDVYVGQQREKIVLNATHKGESQKKFFQQQESSVKQQPTFSKLNPGPTIYIILPYLIFFFVFQDLSFTFLTFKQKVIPDCLDVINNFGNHGEKVSQNSISALFILFIFDQIIVRLFKRLLFNKNHRVKFTDRMCIYYLAENKVQYTSPSKLRLGEDKDLLLQLPDIVHLYEEDLEFQ
ncbi:Transmembrane domain-containing protein [Spironucleus salmonicida]|uniref:Transmembrane domain-containing protein n=1 Tax=Spironucleus salmonicida TaxID=348837 RepID=V6LKR4_9EUKA|nr:Transmembrane domain-containing protein [Spironucleus salmonicida]|eukprot:EST45215.1 Transmembrane domain-containing protein [Spironucleus salmonicida]